MFDAGPNTEPDIHTTMHMLDPVLASTPASLDPVLPSTPASIPAHDLENSVTVVAKQVTDDLRMEDLDVQVHLHVHVDVA